MGQKAKPSYFENARRIDATTPCAQDGTKCDFGKERGILRHVMVLQGYLSFRLELGVSRKRKRPPDQAGSVEPPVEGLVFYRDDQEGESKDEFVFLPTVEMYPIVARALQHRLRVQMDGSDALPATCPAILPHNLRILDPLPATSVDKLELLDLEDLQVADAMDRQMNLSTKSTYSFHGTVWAVSPILDIGSSAFALLELQDAEKLSSCTVVVQETSALAVAATLIPGQSVGVHHARPQKWKVRPVLPDDAGVSNYVFVVNEARQILPRALPPAEHHCMNGRNAVCGVISSVRTIPFHNHQSLVHYIDVKSDQGASIRIFLTYYPMATNQLLSLRIGSTISAHNLHSLDKLTFYASIRSFVGVLTHAPVDAVLKRDLALAPLLYSSKMSKSYRQLYCHHLLIEWKRRVSSLREVQLPPVKDMVALLCPAAAASRNAYAEFYTPETTLDPVDSSDITRVGIRLETMKSLQEAVVEDMRRTLQRFVDQTNELYVGWTCSQPYFGSFILSGDDSRRLLVGGMLEVDSKLQDVFFATMSDGSVCLPAICHGSNRLNLSNTKTFAFLSIKRIVCSVVCLGETSSMNGHALGSFALPSPSRDSDHSSCCILLLIDTWIFLISIFLECDWSSITAPPSSTSSLGDATLEDCLTGAKLESSHFRSVMLRKHFRLGNIKNLTFNNWILALCGSQQTVGGGFLVCPMQSFDIKPSIRVDPGSMTQLRQWISTTIGISLPEDRLVLATVFVQLAVCPKRCALVSGSYDECREPTSTSRYAVSVRLPRLTVFLESKRGFARSKISLDDFFAWPVASDVHKPFANASDPTNVTDSMFGFVGIRKILPGMLDRRPLRRKDPPEWSELRLFNDTGLQYDPPTYTLAELAKEICGDVARSRIEKLSPSLTRTIQNSDVVKITYCRAQGQCMKCYKILEAPKSTNNERKPSQNRISTSSKISDEIIDNVPSFWKGPLPLEERDGSFQPLSTVHSKRKPSKYHRTHLVCPEGCDVRRYVGVKWEVSVTIDDGTGQARLYAEREAAIALLGMRHSDVEAIQVGAMLTADGVSYSPSVHPPRYLRDAVQSARGLAIERARRNRRPLHEEDVLHFMSEQARADYLLQQHCRYSKAPGRPLIFFARCKPLSDNTFLQQTEVNTTALGVGADVLKRPIVSYSLPPLRLNLVELQERCISIHDVSAIITAAKPRKDHQV